MIVSLLSPLVRANPCTVPILTPNMVIVTALWASFGVDLNKSPGNIFPFDLQKQPILTNCHFEPLTALSTFGLCFFLNFCPYLWPQCTDIVTSSPANLLQNSPEGIFYYILNRGNRNKLVFSVINSAIVNPITSIF